MAQQGIRVHVYGDYNDKDIKRAMRDLGSLQTASMGVGARMQAFGGQMQSFGQSVSKVGKSMTVGVTLPIVGVGVAATKMAMDFDTSLTKMVSLVGLTRAEVDGMRGDIIAMASQYGKSASEAADAMFFITSAGLRGSNAMEVLEASLKGAAIGLGDVQTIADLATSAMNAYGAETLGATKATSILRTAVEQGKLESSELAGAMGAVLPIASALGVGFDEVAAGMASMSRTGTNAAAASTQLSAILSAIVKETPKGAKALASVGLSYEGLRRQIKDEGLLATLQTLVSAFGDNTIATAELFGSKRALIGVMDLLGAGAETTEEIFGALAATTENDLNPAFDAAAETTGFKLQQAFATLKNSLIEFGDIIAPFVAQFADRIKQLGESFKALSPQAKEFIVRALAIAAAIGPVLLIVGKLITFIGGLIKVIGLLVGAFNPVTVAIVAIVAAIAGLVAAFVIVWNRTETLRSAVADLMATLKNIARVLIDDLIGSFNRVIGRGTDVQGIFRNIADIAGNVLTRAVQLVTRGFEILGNIVRLGMKVFEAQVKILRMVAGVITGVVVVALDIFMNRLGPVSFAIRYFVNSARTAFSTVGSVVTAVFRNSGAAIENFVNTAIRAINALITAYNKLADRLPQLERITHLTEFRFKSLTASANAAAGATFNAASATGANIREAERAAQPTATLADLLGDVATGYDDVGKSAGGAAKGAKSAGDETEKSGKKLEKFKEKFKEVADALKKAREDIERDYNAMVQSVTSAIMGALDFSAALPEVDENGERVGKTFIEKLQEQAEQAVNFAARIRELIAAGLSLEAIQMVVAAGVSAGTKIADELINGGATAIDETNRLIESTQAAADEIGIEAADHFFGMGLKLAKDTEDAFVKQFGPGGPGWNKLNKMMTALAKSMERTTVITVVTRHITEGAPGRRMGGPVAAGQPYIVGEGGMELFVPQQNGFIIPNHDLRTSMTNTGGALPTGVGGSTINVNINAGMGTDGAEVGRQVVEAIRKYERNSGKVFVAA